MQSTKLSNYLLLNIFIKDIKKHFQTIFKNYLQKIVKYILYNVLNILVKLLFTNIFATTFLHALSFCDVLVRGHGKPSCTLRHVASNTLPQQKHLERIAVALLEKVWISSHKKIGFPPRIPGWPASSLATPHW